MEACRHRTGEEMFSMTRDFFEGSHVSQEEIRKLMSHLTVQKNLCGVSRVGSQRFQNRMSDFLGYFRAHQVPIGALQPSLLFFSTKVTTILWRHS